MSSSNAAQKLFDDEKNLVKCNKGLVLSEEAVAAAQTSMSLGAKASSFALKGLTTVANMAFTAFAAWAISEIISGLYGIANASNEIADKASETGSQFKQTQSDIDSYKKRVQELKEVESDSSSTIEEVTNARAELRTIQSEMIDKYGDEVTSIQEITDAVNNQADAWETLSNSRWQAAKTEFNDTTFTQRVANFLDGYSTNIERMEKEYGNLNQNIMFGSISGKDQQELAANLIQSYGGSIIRDDNNNIQYATLAGNATEVYEKILSIQSQIEKAGYDFGDGFNNNLIKIANGLKETSDKYKDFYDQHVLNDKIFGNATYEDQYKNITDAYQKYNDAVVANDQKAVDTQTKNFAKTVSDAMDKAGADSNVADYFLSMYPELERAVKKWRFEVAFEADTDGLKNDLDGILNGELTGMTSDQLLDFDYASATKPQIDAYNKLSALAENYHMEVADLIPVLEQMGLVVSDSYNQLVTKFGQENVSTLSPEDLQIAYTVSDGSISSWDELIARIAEAKVEASSFQLNNFTKAMEQVDALNTALSAQSSQGYLKPSDIDTLLEVDPNYEAAFQETSNGLTLNVQKAKELTEQNLALRDAEAKAAEASSRTKLNSNIKQMEELAGSTENYQRLLASRDTGNFDEIASEIGISSDNLNEFNSLLGQNDGLRDDIAQWQQIQYGIIGATSLLKQYNDAQSTPDESDAYAAIVKGKENADELYKNGWITKDDFTSYANLVAGYGESDIDAIQNYKKNVERLKKYMTTDKSGNVTSKGLERFLQDSIKSGGIEITKDAEGNELYNIESMDELAKKMNVTTEFAEDMIRALNDAGYSFPIVATEAYKYSKALSEVDYGGESAVESVKSVIEQLQAAQDNGDDVSSSFQDVANAIEKLDEAGQDTTALKQLFAALTGQEYTPEVKFEADTSEVEQAAEEASKPETKRFTFVANGEELNAQISKLTRGQTVNFNAQVNGQNKVVSATKDEYGVIHYTADVDGVETELKQFRNEKGSVYFEADTSEVQKAKEKMEQPTSSKHTTYNNTVNNTTTNNNASGKVNDVLNKTNSSKATITVDANTGVAQGKIRKFLQYIAGVKPKITVNANTSKLGTSVRNALKGTWAIKVKALVSGLPSKGGVAAGTLPSHASGTIVKKSGTAYNVLNMKAHASGAPVGLPADEEAVVNELGNEALIRGGYLYEIPGGTHVQSLKKGDVIINAKDWATIKRNGATSNFAGRAYADGTTSVRDLISTGIPAHAINTSSVGKKIVTTSSSSSKSKSSSKKSSSKSSSKKKSSSSKKKSTSSSSSSVSTSVSDAIQKIADWVNQLFDWIEVKINYLENRADSYYTKAENAISRGLIYSWNYTNAYNNISKAIQTNASLLAANQQGATRYMQQANTVQSKYNSKLSSGDRNTFNSAVNTLKSGGKIDISVYNANVKQALEDYQTWYEKAQDCTKAVDDLNSTLIKQKQELYNLPLDRASEKVKKLEKDLASLNLKYTKLLSGKAASTSTQNTYLDQQLANQKAQVDALNSAMNSAQSTFNSLSKTANANNKAVTSAKSNITSKQKALNTTKTNVNSKGSALLKNSKIKNTLTSAQRTAVNNRQQITLSSKQRKKLTSSQIASINAYNNAVKAVTSATSALSAANSKLSSAQSSAATSALNLELAQQSLQQATQDAAEAEKEYIEQIVENEQQKFENVKNWYQQIIDYEQSLQDLQKSSGAYAAAKDYNTQIENTKKQISALEAQLKSAVNSKKIQEKSAEWYDMKGQIIEVQKSLEELQQTQRKVELEEMFERAMDQADRFISKLETIKDLIQDEMMFDDNGKITEKGMLAISIDNKNFETAKKNLTESIKEIQKIKDDYVKKYGTDFTAGISTEFDELMNDAEDKMLSYLKDVQSYQQSMLDIVLESVETEKDALKDLINTRKEALQKKKEYYDYDKKLKDKNKEINLIRQQVAALQGSSDKTDIAKMQQLQAQLKEAEDDRNETVREHLYDMQSDAFDDLSNTLDEDFEKYTNQLKSSYEEASKAIIAFLNSNGGVLTSNDFERIIKDLVSKFMTSDQVDVSGVTKGYASGTKQVSHRQLAITNEKGQEMIYRASDGSILTRLGKNDAVFSAEKVQALYDMLDKNPVGLQRNFNIVPQSNIVSNNIGGDTYTIDNSVTVQGDLTRDTLPDLHTIIKKSSEYTQNEIRKDLRKAGWKK